MREGYSIHVTNDPAARRDSYDYEEHDGMWIGYCSGANRIVGNVLVGDEAAQGIIVLDSRQPNTFWDAFRHELARKRFMLAFCYGVLTASALSWLMAYAAKHDWF